MGRERRLGAGAIVVGRVLVEYCLGFEEDAMGLSLDIFVLRQMVG